MKTKSVLLLLALSLHLQQSIAQNVELHVDSTWQECSFQIDPSLTQQEWHQFTKESAMVICFRPLVSAKPMGVGKFEFGILRWDTKIDETKGAWNNTFVHPHKEHYLIGGPILPIPGLTLRAGITSRMDIGFYWTASPGANYGFTGAQLQYNFYTAPKSNLNVSSRIGLNRVYGPKDLGFTSYAGDVLASKQINLYKEWLSITPYAGVSATFAHAHEKTDKVNLKDENVFGAQAMIGAVLKISHFNVGFEYNFANVNTMSFKIAGNFGLWKGKKATN